MGIRTLLRGGAESERSKRLRWREADQGQEDRAEAGEEREIQKEKQGEVNGKNRQTENRDRQDRV